VQQQDPYGIPTNNCHANAGDMRRLHIKPISTYMQLTPRSYQQDMQPKQRGNQARE
jgi:hypothetical protein